MNLIQVQEPMKGKKPELPKQKNLLSNPIISAILRNRWYPGVLQVITVAVFGLILFQLLFGPTAAHDNFGTALTWVLWWPLIPIVFLFLGRFWCAVCPFGALSDFVQKIVGNRRKVPRFLKKYGIWIIDALFILITWSDHVWGVVESPWGSGLLLLMLTTGVIVSGAFFERRTWCRYLCFLGGLSGNYARAGSLQLRANPAVCATCKVGAPCYNGNEKAPGCPMFEFPRLMETSASCNLCASCIKACPYGSLQLTTRVPTKELWFIKKPKIEEAFLAVVIMGIVFVQNITMLAVWKELLAGLENLTGTTNYAFIFTITFAIAMLIPILLVGLAALVAKVFNHDSLLSNFTRFGYALIPLDMAGHIAHNLFHLLAEGKAVFFTAFPLFGQPLPVASTAFVSSPTIQIFQYILIALGIFASLYTVYRIARKQLKQHNKWLSFAPYAVLIVLLGAINVFLFMLPMAMRM
jgi:Polyferredoxin